ncbi:MAG: ribbon-helix-helix domain-containing protein [Bryobacteraceae bacterium]
MSAKFQITLPDDLIAEIKIAASRDGVPAAEFIRDSVRERLRKRALRKTGSFWDQINGIVDDPATDTSMRIDEILYGGDPHQ